eukprot:XP_011673341.1 PREDICTED: uncharacterized protein LOC100889257 [Strongylocentrotus purpuratus]
MYTLNPVQPMDRRITRAYAKKMGISVPDIFPNKPQTPVVTETSVNAPTKPADPTPPDRPTTHPQRPTNHGQASRLAMPLRQAPVRDQDSTCSHSRIMPPFSPTPQEPRLVDRHTNDHHRDVPPDLYTPPKPLTTKVNNIIAGHIPKQHELDRITDIFKRKIIRDYNLPIDMRELKTEQQTSPFFKPVYDFLAHEILPSDKKAAKAIRLKAEEYILCDGVLFRLFFDKNDDFRLQLAIPQTLTDIIISQYHDNLLSNHQGTQRTYLTIRRNFYMPNMFERINNYVKACLRCQQFRGKPDKTRPFHTPVPDSY